MTYDDMNSFILNYIENDITGRAIMLTGEWGSGKSYYVKNTLKPFLEDKDNGKHKCVIVSLYGLADTSEISQAIYVDLRTIIKPPSTEAAVTAETAVKIVGKTIFNGLVSKIGFDIASSDNDIFQKVYKSIDLTGMLIVLEDIERTEIDIVKLLGFINNLCENDGVKVLLVTNESELFKPCANKVDNSEENTQNNDNYEKSSKYIKQKEKTITDTIHFHADIKETVNSIIDKYQYGELNSFKEFVTEPYRSIKGIDITNYREVIVACQKTCDIFNYMTKNSITADIEFKKCIFIGLFYYLQKRLYGNDIQFNMFSEFDSSLSGNSIYPLMRFCYEYYHSQILDTTKIKKAMDDYKKYKLYSPYADKDPDLSILDKMSIQTESEINKAIESINIRLDNINDIRLVNYGRIVNYLLFLKYEVHLENSKTNDIITKIINNLKGKGSEFEGKNYLFNHIYEIHDPDGSKEFERIKQEMLKSLADITYDIPAYDLQSYTDTINKIFAKPLEEITEYDPNTLFEIIPLDNIVQFIPQLSPEILDNFRYILTKIDFSRLSENTLSLLFSFKNNIEEFQNPENNQLDCIQKYQLKLICNRINRATGNDSE